MPYSSFGSDNRITLLTALPAASVRAPARRGAALIGRVSLLTILFPLARIAIFGSMRRPNLAHFGNPVGSLMDLTETGTDVMGEDKAKDCPSDGHTSFGHPGLFLPPVTRVCFINAFQARKRIPRVAKGRISCGLIGTAKPRARTVRVGTKIRRWP